jgi:hypothetical protein
MCYFGFMAYLVHYRLWVIPSERSSFQAVSTTSVAALQLDFAFAGDQVVSSPIADENLMAFKDALDDGDDVDDVDDVDDGRIESSVNKGTRSGSAAVMLELVPTDRSSMGDSSTGYGQLL